jgi:hypothetical protein
MKLLLSLLLLAAHGVFALSASSASLPQNQEQQFDAFTRENKVKRAKNPDGLLFTVRFKDNRKQFHQGEVITLELSFASSRPKTFLLDNASHGHSGLLGLDSFVVDRRDRVELGSRIISSIRSTC